MKKHTLSITLMILVFSVQTFAQIALNGTAIKHPYAGLQPDLIDGVSALQATGDPLLRHVYLVDKHNIAPAYAAMLLGIMRSGGIAGSLFGGWLSDKWGGKNAIFFAIKGESFDGHDFVREAFKKGARTAVVSKIPKPDPVDFSPVFESMNILRKSIKSIEVYK